MELKKQKKQENFQTRPAVVVVLGHVDHGKTAILDFIRKTKVIERESGGITQHIGAYEVDEAGKKITFIDTPGHEAFSAMRSRGAKVADIAILVVAGEEGIKPQTKEAINHIKKAGIPMIVAINKTDKPEANPEKVKRELSQQDVLAESMGGKVPTVNVSAKTGKGISELLELILLLAEIQELKGDLSKPGQGVIIEAYLDSHRGPTATLVLRDGILKKGDIIGTGSVLGKIKILEDFQGKQIEKAMPSQPIIVLGLEGVPQIGEKFNVYSDIGAAQKYIEKKERKRETRQVLPVDSSKKILNLILKADVSGSLEAIEQEIKKLPQEKVALRILKSEVGEVNENDVRLAKPAKAKILCFRVKKNPIALKFAEQEKIRIKCFDIIYELFQEVRLMMEKVLSAEIVRKDIGRVKTLVVFMSEKNRQIVGGKIIEGEVEKGLKIEVYRGEEKIGRGKMINLQKNKKDIEKAGKGEEIGILYQGDVKIELGDEVVFYKEVREKGEL
ncbi:translation initiation factor IF-2 [Candidatus Parcubacteria bacterium]|nr:translation initiation factor IF-2 [Candidatus Parcubacteria bacterium]